MRPSDFYKRSHRKVGIEIEYISEISIPDTKSRLRCANIPVYGCNSRDLGWDVKVDGSINACDNGGDYDEDAPWCEECDMSGPCDCGAVSECAPENYGIEIASPPLNLIHNQEHMRQLDTVVQIANRWGRIDSSCGLHVHVGARDLQRIHISRLCSLWDKFTLPLNTYVSPSRRNGSFSHMGWSDDKYSSLSTRPLEDFGTVEFRLHHGTLCKHKIIHWAALCKTMVDWARRSDRPVKGNEQMIVGVQVHAEPYVWVREEWWNKEAWENHSAYNLRRTRHFQREIMSRPGHPMTKLCRLVGIGGEVKSWLEERYNYALENYGPAKYMHAPPLPINREVREPRESVNDGGWRVVTREGMMPITIAYSGAPQQMAQEDWLAENLIDVGVELPIEETPPPRGTGYARRA